MKSPKLACTIKTAQRIYNTSKIVTKAKELPTQSDMKSKNLPYIELAVENQTPAMLATDQRPIPSANCRHPFPICKSFKGTNSQLKTQF